MLRAFALLAAAIALFVSPILMAGGGAAIAHAPAEMPMVLGHCDMPMGNRDAGKTAMKLDCAAACSAIPARAPVLTAIVAPMPNQPLPIGVTMRDGLRPSHELPPPRPAA
jgi:TPP-dependent trihydroxycyclohexane-1,2-dione (THcHDO) dehydratase